MNVCLVRTTRFIQHKSCAFVQRSYKCIDIPTCCITNTALCLYGCVHMASLSIESWLIHLIILGKYICFEKCQGSMEHGFGQVPWAPWWVSCEHTERISWPWGPWAALFSWPPRPWTQFGQGFQPEMHNGAHGMFPEPFSKKPMLFREGIPNRIRWVTRGSKNKLARCASPVLI